MDSKETLLNGLRENGSATYNLDGCVGWPPGCHPGLHDSCHPSCHLLCHSIQHPDWRQTVLPFPYCRSPVESSLKLSYESSPFSSYKAVILVLHPDCNLFVISSILIHSI